MEEPLQVSGDAERQARDVREAQRPTCSHTLLVATLGVAVLVIMATGLLRGTHQHSDSTTPAPPSPSPSPTTTAAPTLPPPPPTPPPPSYLRYNSSCAAHARCGGRSGDCCPGVDGVLLDCCDRVNTSVRLPNFLGMGYTTVPSKVPMVPICDDFMANWSEPLWGPSGRDDLRIIRDFGLNAVRTYGIGSHLNHTLFLDRAQELGLKILPGFADFPYLELGSSCNIQKAAKLPTNCIRENAHECHDTIKAHYIEMLKNGYTILGEDGKRRYHPAISIITAINECELKLMYNNGEQLGINANHARVVVSAVDGILSAEDELNITGPRPFLTATASYATCPLCKSFARRFPKVSGTVPFLPFVADYFLAFQNAPHYIGYTPRHDLLEMYQTRWVNSFNSPRPAASLCEAEDRALKLYAEGPLRDIPVYIGEFHSVDLSPQQFGQDVQKVASMVRNQSYGDVCGVNLTGANIFEFQVSYWKGAGSEGGTATKYGLFGLGSESLGKTHADEETGITEESDVWCLYAAQMGGGVPPPGQATMAREVITALAGKWPSRPALCKTQLRGQQTSLETL